jgi:quercetin dioxygenase-like cupin family protein
MILRRNRDSTGGGEMEGKNITHRSVKDSEHVEMVAGVVRTTLCYNDQTMLCHFTLKKGAKIPIHNHIAAQNGYLSCGVVKFLRKDGDDLVIRAGDGYLFDSNEYHGSEALEDSELVECFTPARPEYAGKYHEAC